MLSFYDRRALIAALNLPLRSDIKSIVHTRITKILADGLGDFTHLLVVTPDDTEQMIEAEIGFSPLVTDGIRYGATGFLPNWDVLHAHGGWFELVYCIGNAGWAVVLLVEDAAGDGWPELRRACREGLA